MKRLYKKGADIDIVALNEELSSLKVDVKSALELVSKAYKDEASSFNLKLFLDTVTILTPPIMRIGE